MEKTPSTQVGSSTGKDLSPVKADLLSDEEPEEKNKKDEPEEETEEDDVAEFILAVDDLESVLSYRDSTDLSYNIATNLKKLDARNLSNEYTMMDEERQEENVGHKRVKIGEDSEISNPVYDTNQLHYHCSEKDRISLCYRSRKRVRFVSKGISKTAKIDLFRMLNKELEFLSRIHAMKMEDLHLLFLEVS